jgi:hypothetical protein
MNRPVQILFGLPKPAVVILAWVMMLFISSLDYITGRDFALSAFYLIPVCWVCWTVGRKAGITLAAGGQGCIKLGLGHASAGFEFFWVFIH